MPFGSKIGFVKAINSTNNIEYLFESCEYSTNAVTYFDKSFCELFEINTQTGNS